METLKTEELKQSTNNLQSIDNIETDISLINDLQQQNPQTTLLDEVEKKTQEISDEIPCESIEIKTENANTTNCLALTIQEDHKLVAFKNVFLRSIRMSWKVVVSTITLALIKLFT